MIDNWFFKFLNFVEKERMKNVIIGCFALSLLAGCGASKKTDSKADEKAKTETPKPKKVQAEYEEM